MDLDLLDASPGGDLVRITGRDARRDQPYDYSAFVPNPLPDGFDLSNDAWLRVNGATRELARLDQAGTRLPDPARFREPFLRREAVSTSALEGTHAAFTDVLEAEALDEERTPQIREILNYVRAARYAIDEVQAGRPITWNLLCRVHTLLVEGTKADGPDRGQQRSTQVLIGPQHCSVEEARFIPPPAGDLLTSGVETLMSWIAARHEALPPVAQVAIAHYQFETLHPFNDGNGRIGRLLVLLHLMDLGEVTQPLLEISGWLEQRRRDYQDHLFEVSATGNFNPWVAFFATAVEVQARNTRERVDALLMRHDEMRNELVRARMSPTGIRIFEHLLERPFVSVAKEAERLSVSFQAANKAVKRLVEVGVLEQTSRVSYDRVFYAPELLALQSP